MYKNIRPKEAVGLIDINYNTVLDLGCRDKILKKYLLPHVKYQGVDYQNNLEVKGWNLEEGIPYKDKSFDIVFALDVLEHLENIHFLFDEILRVATKEVVVAIPNMYYWRHRFKYLFKATLGGKYILPKNKCMDRHRWLTDFTTTNIFISSRLKNDSNYTVIFGRTSNILIINLIDKFLQRYFPNLFSHTVFYKITFNE